MNITDLLVADNVEYFHQCHFDEAKAMEPTSLLLPPIITSPSFFISSLPSLDNSQYIHSVASSGETTTNTITGNAMENLTAKFLTYYQQQLKVVKTILAQPKQAVDVGVGVGVGDGVGVGEPKTNEKKKKTTKKCPHGKCSAGYACKQCNGNGICLHGHYKTTCRKCKGCSICEHGRRRTQCRDCSGSSLCEAHNRFKYACKECTFATKCEHNRLQRNCKECGGAAVCLKHNRSSKYRCSICKLEKANAEAIESLTNQDLTLTDVNFMLGPQ